MSVSSDDWRVKCGLHNPYERNITLIKKFNDDYYKLVTFSSLRSDGFILDSDKNKSKKNSVNDKKLLNNISRARNKIFEYALCNEWEYFVTLTLSPEKLSLLGFDRFDLNSFYKFFANWIHHLDYKVSYLLVPEQHKNGAWHFHGFINGIPDTDLHLFTLDEKLPNYIRNKIKNNEMIYSWISYSNKFGFCDLEFIKNQEKCSSYVTKYISKELYKTINNLGAHCYYCSQGLKKADIVFKEKCVPDIDYDYHNDYVAVKILRKDDIDSFSVT